MKKYIALLLCAIIFSISLFGCSADNPVSVSVSLADEPYVSEKTVNLDGNNNSVEIIFDVPEPGYIKMSAFDNTDYEVWPEEIVRYFISFKDDSGKLLYENIEITDGMLDKCFFESGKVTCELTFENETDEMSSVSLCWAYAPEKDEPVEIRPGETVTSCVNENGEAVFTFTAEESGIYKIAPQEACIYEWDGSFRVETVDGKDVTGELSIHGTEWGSRSPFLPKGEYIVTVSGLTAVACCYVKQEINCEDAILENREGLTVPVQFGFTLLNSGERTVSFNADGSKKSLTVVSGGSDTYYDSVHTANVRITDAEGNVVLEDICEEFYRIDISEYSGEYNITVSATGCGVVELLLMDE